MTYLAVPICGENPERVREQINLARAGGAEMLELRADYLERLNSESVRQLVAEIKGNKRKKLPIIVTCRDKQQGGAKAYPDPLRIAVLTAALQAGADYVDFEYENFLKTENQEKISLALSRSLKGRLILSAHNFEGKFGSISKTYRHITTLCPASIPKLVYMASHINDCFDAFDLLYQTSGERIVFCMGQAGTISRIIAKKLDSFVTFASIDEQNATAPGQLSIKQFRKLYRYDLIDADTKLYGIIGSPVAHSAGPYVHNAGFEAIGANKLYLPLLLEGGREELEKFLNAVLARNWLAFRGFSVTIPHKANAIDYVRARQGYVEPLAKKIGAVNTLLISAEGKLAAYNTDYAGALDAITTKLRIERDNLKDLSVAVVGAGGAARSIVAGLSQAGARIKIYNRTVEKAAQLAGEFRCDFAGLDDLPNLDAKLLINCTSIGMYPDVESTPVPAEYLKRSMAVFDMVYNPAKTLLLRQAGGKRAKTIDGVSMFVNQAMAQFKLFTDKEADAKLMRRVALKFLGQ